MGIVLDSLLLMCKCDFLHSVELLYLLLPSFSLILSLSLSLSLSLALSRSLFSCSLDLFFSSELSFCPSSQFSPPPSPFSILSWPTSIAPQSSEKGSPDQSLSEGYGGNKIPWVGVGLYGGLLTFIPPA